MKLSCLHILFFIVTCFFNYTIKAQNINKLDGFETLELRDKLRVFNDLSDSEISRNASFLLNDLSNIPEAKYDSIPFQLQLVLPV